MSKMIACNVDYNANDLCLVLDPAHTDIIDSNSFSTYSALKVMMKPEVREWCVGSNIAAQHINAYGTVLFEGNAVKEHIRVVVLKFRSKADMAVFKLAWDGVIPG